MIRCVDIDGDRMCEYGVLIEMCQQGVLLGLYMKKVPGHQRDVIQYVLILDKASQIHPVQRWYLLKDKIDIGYQDHLASHCDNKTLGVYEEAF